MSFATEEVGKTCDTFIKTANGLLRKRVANFSPRPFFFYTSRFYRKWWNCKQKDYQKNPDSTVPFYGYYSFTFPKKIFLTFSLIAKSICIIKITFYYFHDSVEILIFLGICLIWVLFYLCIGIRNFYMLNRCLLSNKKLLMYSSVTVSGL